MVDVWAELGKAFGRALKPLAEMGAAIWKGLGDGAAELGEDMVSGAGATSAVVEPLITPYLASIMNEATESLMPGSPKKEIKDASDKLTKALMKALEDSVPKKGSSPPKLEVLLASAAAVIGTNMALYISTSGVTMGLDLLHPLKEIGFREAGADLVASFQLPSMIGPTLQAPIWSGIIAPLRMRMNQKYPYLAPESSILPYLRAKGLITEEVYQDNMRYYALDETWSNHMLANTIRYPSFSELRIMVHRGELTWDVARAALEKSLIGAEYLDAFEGLVPGVPGAGDLVDMAVREAYQARSGDDEMPERFVVEMAKWGFDEEACLWFWRKHWRLPDVGQVYRMNQREIGIPQSLDEFLKWADYAPEWRKPLEDLSWNLPGRIDARWMFRWDQIDVTELRDLLVKNGLDPEYADGVAIATAKNQFLSDINRQVANIKADYSRGYSIEATLRSELGDLGLRSELVEFHVLDALADRARAIHDEELRTLRAQYARGAINMADVVKAATPIIVDPVARDAWLGALPTAKQVIIMEETFTTEVNRLVANAKYDAVRGYIEKPALVSRLQLLALPEAVIEFHVMDAEEDRVRAHRDKSLTHIEEGYVDDLISWEDVQAMAGEILVDEAAYDIWLDGVWLNKHKAVRVFARE